ncbi:hypothetical protein V3H27_23190 [Vibrio parahaemolyticus]|uniref:hypothetical protein n=1 Tax=Vibrio parahaemolyticus TaxID=670 RepID=UPI000D546D93|nr:hypothetical protein [Vibrio parahaemolyticus]AWG87348.1 unknow [Vibrio parahaemolyticus]
MGLILGCFTFGPVYGQPAAKGFAIGNAPQYINGFRVKLIAVCLKNADTVATITNALAKQHRHLAFALAVIANNRL